MLGDVMWTFRCGAAAMNHPTKRGRDKAAFCPAGAAREVCECEARRCSRGNEERRSTTRRRGLEHESSRRSPSCEGLSIACPGPILNRASMHTAARIAVHRGQGPGHADRLSRPRLGCTPRHSSRSLDDSMRVVSRRSGSGLKLLISRRATIAVGREIGNPDRPIRPGWPPPGVRTGTTPGVHWCATHCSPSGRSCPSRRRLPPSWRIHALP